jgi:AAA domain, putative AbiEii toxin, Type IV TA system
MRRLPVAPHLNAIRISNFRSIVEPLEVPLKSKMTFLVGQNNSGKTGILRFLGLLLNDGVIIPEDVSLHTTKVSQASYFIASNYLREFAQLRPGMVKRIRTSAPLQFEISQTFKGDRKPSLNEDLLEIIDVNYFDNSQEFMTDFSQSGGRQSNIQLFLDRLWVEVERPKTVFVPSQRAILANGIPSIPQFGQNEFPGTKISLNSIVDDLAKLDRPHGTPVQKQEARDKLSRMCAFIAYCLEVQRVEINIPDGKPTINVSIDGNEQPISNLGSGIEQLIVIGMGSFVFPGHLVLIDEPEMHFHPHTQKRMMRYLHKNADAKFVIATHSAAILDSVEADIVQVWQENHQCFGRTVQNNSDRYDAIRNLGHSPSELVLANFVIWVEGPSDRIYINHWIKRLDPTLVEGTDYAIIFYGGAVLARHGFEDSD